MPFIGRDWRSPGEAWVKTDEGSWEKLKILETSVFNRNRHGNINVNCESCSSEDSSAESDCESDASDIADSPDSGKCNSVKKCVSCESPITGHAGNCTSTLSSQSWPPFCQITLKSTKEVAGCNTISEAFHRLDFCSAICDIRRFNYVTKLLHLLINHNLTNLSGCATKVLFSLLEQLAWQVAANKQNIHILHTLIADLKRIVNNYYCWGRPLGSTAVWQTHLETLEKICQKVASIEIKEPADDGAKRLSDLPEELIRQVLLRLSDYRDLINSATAYSVMGSILDEQHIWRELCKYHFGTRCASVQVKNAAGQVDWEQTFQLLRRKYSLKEEYADTLVLCRYCRCLFWKSFGHPCVQCPDESHDVNGASGGTNGQSVSSESSSPRDHAKPSIATFSTPLHIPVPPQAFLKFFSL